MTDHKELRRLAAEWLSPYGDRAIRLLRADGKNAHAQAFEEGQKMAKAVTALLDELDQTHLECAQAHLARASDITRWKRAERDLEKAVAERDQLRAASGTLVGHIIGVQVFLQSLGTPLAHDLVKLGTVAIKDATEALTTPLPAAATTLQADTAHHATPTLPETMAGDSGTGVGPRSLPPVGPLDQSNSAIMSRLEAGAERRSPGYTGEVMPERQFFNMDGSPRYYPEDSRPAADSVQVRTPGTIEVCELCKVPIVGFFNDGCWRTNHPTAPCPIRPKQGV